MIDFDAMLDKHREVQRKKEALAKLEAKATDTSAKITGMPGGGGDGQRMAQAVVDIAMARESLDIAENELEGMKKALRPYLRRLDRWQHKDVIKYRYMEGNSLEDICDKINYSWSQTNRYLTEAKAIIIRKMEYNGIPDL